MLSHMEALAHADGVIDMDRLSRLPPYARALSDELLHATGVDLDLADCTLPANRLIDGAVNVRAVRRELSERILLEQPDARPEIVRHWHDQGDDYAGPTATGAARRA